MPIKADYFPDEFNELRKELSTNFPALFQRVGWFMAWDREQFMEAMNKALDLRIPFDTDNVTVCKTYLMHLRRKGTESALLMPKGYEHGSH